MIKKAVMIISGAMLAGVLFAASSVETKAALPSTQNLINDANAKIAATTQAYEAAKANEAALMAAFNAVKADPNHSQLAYEKAAYDYQNAINVSQWCLAQVNNAKAYLKNTSDTGAFEDKFWANKAALADLTTLQASKTVADGASNIANGTLQQIRDVEKAIAGYQQQLATSPSLQPQIDELGRKLEILKADYAAKAATASDTSAVFANNINTLNYKPYSKGFEDYQFRREWERDNEKWDPKGYDY
jgi:uncharacterized protein involved in exopolysaccharide biosynthesis